MFICCSWIGRSICISWSGEHFLGLLPQRPAAADQRQEDDCARQYDHASLRPLRVVSSTRFSFRELCATVSRRLEKSSGVGRPSQLPIHSLVL